MSYDRSFGADRHDLGSRTVLPATAGETELGLAGRVLQAFRRTLNRGSEKGAAEHGHAALDRIANAAARGPADRATATAGK